MATAQVWSSMLFEIFLRPASTDLRVLLFFMFLASANSLKTNWRAFRVLSGNSRLIFTMLTNPVSWEDLVQVLVPSLTLLLYGADMNDADSYEHLYAHA